MDIKTLQCEAHAIAKEKGRWDEEPSFGDLIAFVHQDVDEIYRQYQPRHRHRPYEFNDDGIAEAFADVMIRVADMAEHYRMDLAKEVEQLREYNWTGDIYDQIATFGEWITLCHYQVSTSMLHHWGGHPSFPGSQPFRYLALLIKYLQLMAEDNGIDLDAVIKAKMESNRGRAYRHGGRRFD